MVKAPHDECQRLWPAEMENRVQGVVREGTWDHRCWKGTERRGTGRKLAWEATLTPTNPRAL